MQLSHLRHITGLWCACAVACLVAVPALAQTAAPSPPAVARSPLQGAREALVRAHGAKNLGELNGSLTNEAAADIGFGLVLADSMMSGMATAMTDALTPKGTKPKGVAREEASEKAFQDKVEALLKRYSLDGKTLKGADKSGVLPPGLIARGHQFLADALVLSDDYEKGHASPKGAGTLGSQISGSDLPAPEACDFHALTPSHVKIVPRAKPKSPIDALLEGGQWRLDMMGASAPSAPSRAVPRFKPLTPKAAALLRSIDDGDLEAVRQELKADPALANTPPGYFHGHSGSISDTPLALAAFKDDPKTAALLLQSGAAVNADDGFGSTALDRASRLGHADVVAVLLGHGADSAHRDDSGETALHLAAEGDDLATVTLLLARGAEINARDHDGKTPLGLALGLTSPSADHSAILDLLRRHGAKK